MSIEELLKQAEATAKLPYWVCYHIGDRALIRDLAAALREAEDRSYARAEAATEAWRAEALRERQERDRLREENDYYRAQLDPNRVTRLD